MPWTVRSIAIQVYNIYYLLTEKPAGSHGNEIHCLTFTICSAMNLPFSTLPLPILDTLQKMFLAGEYILSLVAQKHTNVSKVEPATAFEVYDTLPKKPLAFPFFPGKVQQCGRHHPMKWWIPSHGCGECGEAPNEQGSKTGIFIMYLQHARMNKYIHTCTHACMYILTFMYRHVHVNVYLLILHRAQLYIYTYMCVCVVCKQISTYMHIYIYIHLHYNTVIST